MTIKQYLLHRDLNLNRDNYIYYFVMVFKKVHFISIANFGRHLDSIYNRIHKEL